MKKLALLLIGVLLGFLLCYFFFGKAEGMADDGVPPPKPSKGLIDPSTISQLDKRFDGRHALINSNLGIHDNRSSWYSLEDLRKYLDYAEYEARHATPSYKMDGVRIYLGVSDSSDGKPGLTTMMFVPTSSAISSQYKSKGSMFNFNFQPSGGGDIPGGSGLDMGGQGNPPGANYPQ